MASTHPRRRNPKRIWVLSELYFPEETGTGHFMTGIAESLAVDFDVRVICSQPTYSQRGTTSPLREIRQGVRIIRVRATRLSKDSMIGRLLNALTITVSIFGHALAQLRAGDGMLVVTNPPTLPFVAVLAARLRRARPVLLIHDVYPEVLVATGLVRPDGLIVRALRLPTRWLYRASARIVVLGRDMRDLAETKRGPSEHPVVVVPNWGDIDVIKPTDRSKNLVLEELGLSDRFVVQIMGNMGRAQGIETVVDAAQLLAEDDRVHFLFVGWGARRQWLEDTIANRKLLNVSVLPPRPRPQSAGLQNACDISCITLLPGMTGVAVPSRLYNVLAAGRPVLAVADYRSELALVTLEEGVGFVIPPDDANALARAILEAAAHPDDLATMGARARQVAEVKYSRKVIVETYKELFAELFERDT